MRAAQLDENDIVINYAEVGGFGGSFIDPLNSVLGALWNGASFVNPIPPVLPAVSAEQARANYIGMMQSRADVLQAAGFIVEALLLRESLK